MQNKLYVGQLPYSTTEDTLKSYFSQCGRVTSVKIIKDKETGRSRGFAFVEMSTSDEADACIKKFNGQDFEGRKLIISEAKPKSF